MIFARKLWITGRPYFAWTGSEPSPRKAGVLYQDGLDNYLSVSVAQVQALAAQTTEVQVRARQIQAAVALIRALGGGWMMHVLPSEQQTLPFGPLDYHGASAKE